jgi:hypothetical protein
MTKEENLCVGDLQEIKSTQTCPAEEYCKCEAASQLADESPRSNFPDLKLEPKQNLKTTNSRANIVKLIKDKLNPNLKSDKYLKNMSREDRLRYLPMETGSILCRRGELCASGLLQPECLQIYDNESVAAVAGTKDLEDKEKGKYGKTVAFKNSKKGGEIQVASCVPFQTFFFHNKKMKCKNPEKNPDKSLTAKSSKNFFDLAHGQICFIFIDETTCSCGKTTVKQCKRGQKCLISGDVGSCHNEKVYYGCAEDGNCYCSEAKDVLRWTNNDDNYCLVDYKPKDGDQVENLKSKGKYFKTKKDFDNSEEFFHLSPEFIVAQMWLKDYGGDALISLDKQADRLLQKKSLRVKKTLRAIV